MKLRIIKQDFLDRLQNQPLNELTKWYRREQPWFTDFFKRSDWMLETKIELAEIPELTREGEPSKTDIVNAIRIYNMLKGKLTEVQASDPRLWVYLCHETFWDYMKWRWPPDQQGTIETRYFVKGSSGRSLTRNGIARLWWFAHLTFDSDRPDNYELTAALLKSQDIQHNLLERNFGRNRSVLKSVLEFLRDHTSINRKEDYVKIGKYLNRLGGVHLLDWMDSSQIYNYLESIFHQK